MVKFSIYKAGPPCNISSVLKLLIKFFIVVSKSSVIIFAEAICFKNSYSSIIVR